MNATLIHATMELVSIRLARMLAIVFPVTQASSVTRFWTCVYPSLVSMELCVCHLLMLLIVSVVKAIRANSVRLTSMNVSALLVKMEATAPTWSMISPAIVFPGTPGLSVRSIPALPNLVKMEQRA